MEVLWRHDTRIGGVERTDELKRDIGELKSDMMMMENRLLTRAMSFLRRSSGWTIINSGLKKPPCNNERC
jgi:hypothetical protein